MPTHPMTLLTIVCESHARGRVLDLLRTTGAHGWTLFPVEGTGAQGGRPADIPEYTNLQIQVIVKPPVANEILEQLGRDFFPRYAMVAFTSDIQVLRAEKF